MAEILIFEYSIEKELKRLKFPSLKKYNFKIYPPMRNCLDVLSSKTKKITKDIQTSRYFSRFLVSCCQLKAENWFVYTKDFFNFEKFLVIFPSCFLQNMNTYMRSFYFEFYEQKKSSKFCKIPSK